MRAYEYKHVVGLEETNLVGNIYFVNHVRWQGRCREMFLRDKAPDILEAMLADLRLVTLSCSCQYLLELRAFDEVTVRMRLGKSDQNRMTLLFEYLRITGENSELIARGEQEIACMRLENGALVPTAIPPSLQRALEPYR